ncbi:MAG TPA: hypothetical protein VGJ28_27075, partial [Micromonosporaceae bacterium]
MTPADSTLIRTGIPAQRTSSARSSERFVVLSGGVWPASPADVEPPGVAGFIVSSFSPLAVEAAERAMRAYVGAPPDGEQPPEQPVTAVIIVSSAADDVSARAVADAVDVGGRIGPLMFFQSVPTAVAGYIAARWHLTGPVVAISPAAGDAITAAADAAGFLFDDGDAERALL